MGVIPAKVNLFPNKDTLFTFVVSMGRLSRYVEQVGSSVEASGEDEIALRTVLQKIKLEI